MNWFDQSIIHFLNSFAHHSRILDAVMVQICNNVLINGGVLMAMFWWAWMKDGEQRREDRELLAGNIVAIAFAVVLGRLLALSLPYRERPIHEPRLHFQLPYGLHPATLIHWSSFPSDHSVLTFCIVTGLWMVSRRLGIVAAVYGLGINIPRIYVGIHYPTDVVAGIVLGVAMGYLFKLPSLRNIVRTSLNYLDPYPAYLYALLFVCTFEIAEMFESLRQLAVLAAKTVMLLTPGEVNAVGIPLLVLLLGILGWLCWRRHKAAA
jgi:undecaprenyl-diphosphatase